VTGSMMGVGASACKIWRGRYGWKADPWPRRFPWNSFSGSRRVSLAKRSSFVPPQASSDAPISRTPNIETVADSWSAVSGVCGVRASSISGGG
jgi:hypothetical protein